jgi:hypothetical protein
MMAVCKLSLSFGKLNLERRGEHPLVRERYSLVTLVREEDK